MRIERINAVDLPPIKRFDISSLGDVVVIAGANGSGKTRLRRAIVETFQTPASPQVDLEVKATRPAEVDVWGTAPLQVKKGIRSDELFNYMQRQHRGHQYLGTAVQIDSKRSIQPVAFTAISVQTPDPDEADIPSTYYLNDFAGRWQELVNRIYAKAANTDQKIAAYAKAHAQGNIADALAENPDPFTPYQNIFAKLLPGKKLCQINPKAPQEFQFTLEGSDNPLPFSALSSGEQEVIKVAFDLNWKQIEHCIILIDEPELHLHPTLAFRLIESIKATGNGTNQLLLFTHSADLISTYFSSGSVYFIDESAKDNQAKQLSRLSEDHSQVARAMGANLGVLSVGKKLLFVEGTDTSIDRLSYYKIAQEYFPSAYVLPLGSVQNITTLKAVSEEIEKAIFGIDLFMVRDRDGLTDDEIESLEQNPRIRCLRRRHLENYFLDSTVLSTVAKHFYVEEKECKPEVIRAALERFAKESLNDAIVRAAKDFVSTFGVVPGPSIKGAQGKKLEDLKAELGEAISEGVKATEVKLSGAAVKEYIEKKSSELSAALHDGKWEMLYPGKTIFARLCGEQFHVHADKVRAAYVDVALKSKPNALQDIIDAMKHFAAL